MFLSASISILSVAIAFGFGGWEWATILTASLLSNRRFLTSPLAVIEITSISFLWLAAFLITGDRRLYFPFTIQLAVQALALPTFNPPSLSATAIVALFSAIRLIQQATLIVLTVELVVAAVAIAIPAYIYRNGKPTPLRRFATATLGSILAFAGLVF